MSATVFKYYPENIMRPVLPSYVINAVREDPSFLVVINEGMLSSSVPTPKHRVTTLKIRGFVLDVSEDRVDPFRCPRERRTSVYQAEDH